MDQGAQFTSHDFVNALKAHPIRISMDGRGRAADNIFVERLWRTVKYEDIYLQDYETLAQVQVGLKMYFTFYNGERGHQSLGYQTPDGVYATGQGGGAKIIDKFGRLAEPVSAPPPEDEAAPQGNEQQVFCWT
jgi:putative transposase